MHTAPPTLATFVSPGLGQREQQEDMQGHLGDYLSGRSESCVKAKVKKAGRGPRETTLFKELTLSKISRAKLHLTRFLSSLARDERLGRGSSIYLYLFVLLNQI